MIGRGNAPFIGIHHVQLAAPPGGEETARQFYGGTLGLIEIDHPVEPPARSGVWFQCGEHELHVTFEDDFQASCATHVSLQMINPTTLGALQVQLELDGMDVLVDDSIDRYRRFLVADPFGNRLEFMAARY